MINSSHDDHSKEETARPVSSVGTFIVQSFLVLWELWFFFFFRKFIQPIQIEEWPKETERRKARETAGYTSTSREDFAGVHIAGRQEGCDDVCLSFPQPGGVACVYSTVGCQPSPWHSNQGCWSLARIKNTPYLLSYILIHRLKRKELSSRK